MNLNYDQSVNYLENFFYPLNRTRPHYTQVNSPYYVVENGTTTFFSLDGRTSFTEPTIPEKIYVIDHNAIAYRNKGRLVLLDASLNPILISEIEDASSPIQNRMLIKTEGTWKLVELTETSKTAPEKERMKEEQTHIAQQADISYVVTSHPQYSKFFE